MTESSTYFLKPKKYLGEASGKPWHSHFSYKTHWLVWLEACYNKQRSGCDTGLIRGHVVQRVQLCSDVNITPLSARLHSETACLVLLLGRGCRHSKDVSQKIYHVRGMGMFYYR